MDAYPRPSLRQIHGNYLRSTDVTRLIGSNSHFRIHKPPSPELS